MIDVRSSARFISEQARFVNIDDRAVDHVVWKIASHQFATPTSLEMHPFKSRSPEEIAMWCFVLDSVNFCFWADPGEMRWSVSNQRREQVDGYWALVAALLRGVKEVPLLDPTWLSTISSKDTHQLFRGKGEIPLIDQRQLALQELGQSLLRSKKSAWEVVQNSKGDVIEFIDTVLSLFPLFRDESTYQDRQVGLYKRAQILCQDLSLEFSLVGIRPFTNLQSLTAFADYKLPQLFRDEGVFQYNPSLSEKIDATREFTAGSSEEVEIRGCTIHVVELIRDRLSGRGVDVTSADLDNVLWTEAVKRGQSMKPYHRVRTTNY